MTNDDDLLPLAPSTPNLTSLPRGKRISARAQRGSSNGIVNYGRRFQGCWAAVVLASLTVAPARQK